jgi:tellurite resistance protein
MDVLDLTHLDEEERRVIMAVIKRDEEFEKSENERIRRLKNSVETQRRTGQVSPAIERCVIIVVSKDADVLCLCVYVCTNV